VQREALAETSHVASTFDLGNDFEHDPILLSSTETGSSIKVSGSVEDQTRVGVEPVLAVEEKQLSFRPDSSRVAKLEDRAAAGVAIAVAAVDRA
jgi:hypothetical protein